MAEAKKGKANARRLTAALRELGVEELKTKIAEKQEQLMRDRFRHATASLSDTALLKTTRREIARMQTVLQQKQQEALNERS